MNQSEQINELASALAKAQQEIGPAYKDAVNPFFKSKYADLSSVWSACKQPLTKHGLAVLQTVEYQNDRMVLVTTLAHSSGQWMKSCMPIISAKQDAQGIGSAITYMRRYSLAAMVGVTTEDDDGNSACEKQNIHPKQEYISDKQAQELKGLLASCGNDYESRVLNHLRNSPKPIDGIDHLPVHLYESVKGAALKKIKEKEVVHA